jgi:hypothetical protein
LDEVRLSLQQGKGVRAQELLNSESFKETLTYLENEYMSAWRKCREQDTAARERLWTAVRVLDHIRAHLAKVAVDGRIATKDLAGIKYLKR